MSAGTRASARAQPGRESQGESSARPVRTNPQALNASWRWVGTQDSKPAVARDRLAEAAGAAPRRAPGPSDSSPLKSLLDELESRNGPSSVVGGSDEVDGRPHRAPRRWP